MNWWDGLAPLLTAEPPRDPRSTCSATAARRSRARATRSRTRRALVAEALAELGVERGDGGRPFARRHRRDRARRERPTWSTGVVIIDQAPDNELRGASASLAKLGYVPVIGQAIWRVDTGLRLVKDQYQRRRSRPGFNIPSGFDNPDQVVDDLRAMTYTAYTDAAEAEDDYTDEQPLDRAAAPAGVPLLVIFGAEDQIYDAEEAIERLPRGARRPHRADPRRGPLAERREARSEWRRCSGEVRRPTHGDAPRSRHRARRRHERRRQRGPARRPSGSERRRTSGAGDSQPRSTPDPGRCKGADPRKTKVAQVSRALRFGLALRPFRGLTFRSFRKEQLTSFLREGMLLLHSRSSRRRGRTTPQTPRFGAPTASGRRPSPTPPCGRPSRNRRRRGARRGGGRGGRGPRRLGDRSAEQRSGPSSIERRLGQRARPPSAAPWIAQGTTCSSRQKTARRSPAGS